MSKHRVERRSGGTSRILTLLLPVPLLAVGALLLALVTGVFGDTGRADGPVARGDVGGAADVAGSAVRGDEVSPAPTAVPSPELTVAPQVTIEPRPKPRPKKVRPTTASATFQIGSLNVLGSNHAPNGLGRAAREAGLLRSRGIDLVGLQEVQRDQRPVLERNLPGYQVWPGDDLGRQGYRVQIAYRADRFEKVDSGSVQHTFDSQTVPIPWLRLRDRASGGEFYMIATHNSPRDMQGQRNASTETEARLVNALEESGKPVLLVGDFNEHESFYCRIAARTGLVSANGGSYAGGCRVPPRPIRIDWILGSAGRVDFSGYHQDGTTLSGRMSDHYLVYATAELTMPLEQPLRPSGGAGARTANRPVR